MNIACKILGRVENLIAVHEVVISCADETIVGTVVVLRRS